ncbi:MAG: MBL fold metallo-hydrolase [Dysgonamonadaceae bacterium]|jgi:phosphoribosyl 1,2-cyclic phosphodiesterase|nr:MBL fold metallo-hydrolase [Dysgonamonadaceae bacterium]
MHLKFLTLASGSSGNCYFLGTDEFGVLFDAGISIRAIKKTLKDNNIDLGKIMAVFITHDHADHILSVGSLGDKYGIPVYATEPVHKSIENSKFLNEKLGTSRRTIEKEVAVNIKDFKITAFDVPHDSRDCVGYMVDYRHHKWVLATDVGTITNKAGEYIRMANHLVIEANYDIEMLEKGKYPKFLKERISNGNGHLSNLETATFLAANFDLHMKNVWLCHLSNENNHPDLAYKTVEMEMGKYGIRIGKDFSLTVLKRTVPSTMFILQ